MLRRCHWAIFVAICLPIQLWRRCNKVARKHPKTDEHQAHPREGLNLFPVLPDRFYAF